MQNNPFYKFYQKSLDERKEILFNHPTLTSKAKEQLNKGLALPESIANQMVENQIEIYGLPYGIVPELIVNGKSYIVPMVTEEPSVIAAASYASKLINLAGGATTLQEKREMIGEIAIVKSPLTLEEVKTKLEQQRESLFSIANNAHPSIVKRGGGIREIWVEEKSTDKEGFFIFYVSVDTKEAMGANMLNTILEALLSPIESMTCSESIMAILSNLATNSVVTAKCVLSPRILNTITTKGEDEQEHRFLIWDRNDFWTNNKTGKAIYFGHTPSKDGKIRHYVNDVHCIDTGSYKNGIIACVELKTGKEIYIKDKENKKALVNSRDFKSG